MEMKDRSKSTAGFLKQTRLIHLVMLAGVTMFLAVSIYLSYSGALQLQNDPEFSNLLFLLTAGLTIIMLPAGYILFRKQISAIEHTLGLEEKLMQYRSAWIVKMGLTEAPAFFSIVVLLLTANPWLLIQIIAVLLVMAINRPSAEKIVNDLSLDGSQIEAIRSL